MRATPHNSEDGQRALRVEAAIEMKPRKPAFTRSFGLALAFVTIVVRCVGQLTEPRKMALLSRPSDRA